MKDQFCTKDISISLKELGYSEPCLAWWHVDGKVSAPTRTTGSTQDWNHEVTGTKTSAPLWQQVIDWFRTAHNIEIKPQRFYFNDSTRDAYFYEVTQLHGISYIHHLGDNLTYYQAHKQAIEKAIEIVNNKPDEKV